MGSLFLSILAVAAFVCSALNARLQGSAEDEYNYAPLRANLGFQCDARDTACIEEFIRKHQQVESSGAAEGVVDDSYPVEPQRNHLDFLSLISGRNSGTELEKRKDYSETEFKSHYLPSCACQANYEPLDLGYNNFPRYIMSAVCLNREDTSRKCWRGSRCREVPFKVHVLTHRTNGDSLKDQQFDDDARTSSMVPDSLRSMWRVKIVTVASTCQCTQ
ncbi:uncharacterized protein LOC129791464 [Lutzomyia longipalpis]|uniref:uncharacterized protein LOC129791464 n=1 Tax=Lutzomyia longipalpis TaxID=7200 RepID=UPI0024839E76|nr:uncharacterized protein LOC129791464 [Lutzomyia longipalpis]